VIPSSFEPLADSFEPLANEHPNLRAPLRRIQDWVRQHSEQPTIDPRSLANDLHDVDDILLAQALVVLAKSKLYRPVFRVTTPSGGLAHQEFDNLAEIPNQLSDDRNDHFDTNTADIVQVLKRR
jgi:hypothetical protein